MSTILHVCLENSNVWCGTKTCPPKQHLKVAPLSLWAGNNRRVFSVLPLCLAHTGKSFIINSAVSSMHDMMLMYNEKHMKSLCTELDLGLTATNTCSHTNTQ